MYFQGVRIIVVAGGFFSFRFEGQWLLNHWSGAVNFGTEVEQKYTYTLIVDCC